MEQRGIARRGMWKTTDMPERREEFVMRRHVTPLEMQCLRQGNVPAAQEDKWFWYMEEDTLYAHRSWTGYCIYILKFTPGSDEIHVTVNRDPEQYRSADYAEDIKNLYMLLHWWSQPGYDYYHEWLAETVKALQGAKAETLLVNGYPWDAVYFHRTDEPNGYLSNWYPSPFTLDGHGFNCVEQYIMYRKCLLFGDPVLGDAVLDTPDPARQKEIGRGVRGYNETLWSGMRQVILTRGLMAKFSQNEELKKELLGTGSAFLVECAKSDTVWACGVGLTSLDRKDIAKWRGSNILGFALMEVRAELAARESARKKPAGTLLALQGDITKLPCDAIVNAANRSLLGGGGVDGAIHRAAGSGLLAECRTLGGCATGQARITKGYNLPARWVIHTVGPVYSGKPADAQMLRACYIHSLDLAREHDIHSVAFPAISTGVYGYPLGEATAVAVAAVRDWLRDHPDWAVEVIFCCFDKRTLEEYERVLKD